MSTTLQIHAECKRFGKAYNLRSVAVYGGGSMWEQAKALQEGAEIVVCTPVSMSWVQSGFSAILGVERCWLLEESPLKCGKEGSRIL